MPTTLTMDQLADVHELDLGVSEWVTVAQAMIDDFVEATGDHQWVHADPARAAEGPYATTIADGYLTLSLLPALVGSMLTVSDGTVAVNYGLDRLRLTGAVRAGQRVRARALLASAVPKAGGLLVRIQATVEIEDEDRPALVAETLSLRYGGGSGA